MEKSRVGLKVTGIVLGIIFGVAALAVAFRFTVLPVWKYNVAISNAEKGDYALATRGLYNNKYRDSETKLQEYAFNAGKAFLAEGDLASAEVYLTVAVQSGSNEDIAKDALLLLEEIAE